MGNSLTGKVAIVTGSGQGVGRGIAVYLAREGAKVITNNRKACANFMPPAGIDESEKKEWLSLCGDAETTAQLIRAEGGESTAYFCDVANYDDVKKMMEFTVKAYGRIDILVNNAAICEAGALMSLSESDWDKQTVVKMKGAFNCMKHVIPIMREQHFGRILNCSSDAWTGMGNAAAYSAANAGIVALTQSVSREEFRYGITCNTYCPQANSPAHIVGFAKTLQTLSEALGEKVTMSKEHKEFVEANHGDATDMAPFLAYLCTEAAGEITGETFSVTAAGRVSRYTEPVMINEIYKNGEPWTVDELKTTVFDTLMKGYVNKAKKSDY